MTHQSLFTRTRAGAADTPFSRRVDRLCARAYGILVIAVANLSVAQAQDGSSPAAILTKITSFILGPFGQSLAILGIIAIGVSWMFGRASLGLIAGVIGGIVIMFGASYIGQQLTGGGG